ncbi:SMI1/KNR4 family protein [Saccharibacillus alkalitolerans]|uniref:SMI1/KNR4 family protein n=1 Tax=Saccharibacillus alkalitolerans TaxID=2705290 RepID=A0ABX0FB17_9BACL|nr:SMI1/KNR4 family protein [Saccharibacillus alkalitolerans]NGZ77160.1 SMI1/KNR4 family protein [Saccharibacillus alkalitolerans]
MNQQFESTLVRLAQGELSPEEWREWWDRHRDWLEGHLSRGVFLKLKPIRHDFRWAPLLASQRGAAEYLTARGVPFTESDEYRQQHEREFAAFRLAQQERNKALLEQLRGKVPELFRVYPKFAASLRHVYTESDVLDAGAPLPEIERMEELLDMRLPGDVREHFAVAENISIEGIRLELGMLRDLDINGKRYLCLGEFWKEADGDLLLLKPEAADICAVYYYAHERNKVSKLCSGMKALMENKFAYYNRR